MQTSLHGADAIGGQGRLHRWIVAFYGLFSRTGPVFRLARVTYQQRPPQKSFVNDNGGLHPAGNFVEAFGLQCHRASPVAGFPVRGGVTQRME
ncbi:hypothetical protein BOSE62_40118 [Bosea sp. 62]|nr:hypothetical protein BOSE46_120670 [Bosea sp. 46]CAD5264243.1 hypothetical protein BOSE21B_110904 [Bosea sp. 21B]CAD5276066.1 hypothetical protein BOSE7B_40312 [Bosea sp. 7B]VVT59085.1 hypothetical protein BOS5A_200952 [Bosea sp. EC-HK365B]VXB68343.1 hypothetical protein BOSE29B_110835 [Bosea sp. 29B]VXC08537.1 hypothetical protein BOSE125_160626 [Bosea sp. 125]VXC32936.1 hypothetical protein BOSE62_40118 [Bosea sp. 62]VXC76851.1 hypothetical protein BOSE127_50020 [Bosea sp. 127]